MHQIRKNPSRFNIQILLEKPLPNLCCSQKPNQKIITLFKACSEQDAKTEDCFLDHRFNHVFQRGHIYGALQFYIRNDEKQTIKSEDTVIHTAPKAHINCLQSVLVNLGLIMKLSKSQSAQYQLSLSFTNQLKKELQTEMMRGDSQSVIIQDQLFYEFLIDKYSFSEIVSYNQAKFKQMFEQKYTKVRSLGEGYFAQVFEVLNNQDNKYYAIKQIQTSELFLEDIESELQHLLLGNSVNAVQIVEHFYDSCDMQYNIVMELCKGSLRQQINNRTVFDEERLIRFLVEMTDTFLKLNKHKLRHLALNPQNILWADESGKSYKISDFSCEALANVARHQINKIFFRKCCEFSKSVYIAPEIQLGFHGHTTQSAADVWSLGIILYQMIFWRLPFPIHGDNYDIKIFTNYFQKKGFQINYDIISGGPHRIIQIIKLMLTPIPANRINWTQLKSYLIKKYRVQEFEFLNIEDMTRNFIPVTTLCFKILDAIAQQVSSSTHPFWKINQKFLLQVRQKLIYYCFISCEAFRKIFQIKQKDIGYDQRQLANQLLNKVVEQRQNCSQKINIFEVRDFTYRQAMLYDQLKECIDIISNFNENMDVCLQLLHSFCLDLVEIIRLEKSLFGDVKFWKQSLKAKTISVSKV